MWLSVCSIGYSADKQIYVDPDVAAGDSSGDSWTNAYSSLNIAEAAEDQDITAIGIFFFHLKSRLGNADTTGVTFAGWVTDSTHYIVLQGGYAAGESGSPGTPERLSGYSTSHYRLAATDMNLLIFSEDFGRFDSLQVGLSTTGSGSGSGINITTIAASNDIRISNCIIAGISVTGTAGARGIVLNDAQLVAKVWNCPIYNFISAGTPGDASFRGIHIVDGLTIDIWNCVVNDCRQGVENDSGGTTNLINCLIFENTDDFLGSPTSVTYTASDDNDEAGAGNFQITQTADDYAALVTDADGRDYSVTDASSELYQAGNGATPKAFFTKAIDGTDRDAVDLNWDIGAFELEVVAGFNMWFIRDNKKGGKL